MKVTCPIDKLKELILSCHLDYYSFYPKMQKELISNYTPDIDVMWQYMEDTKSEVVKIHVKT